jgi:hypothetical protein
MVMIMRIRHGTRGASGTVTDEPDSRERSKAKLMQTTVRKGVVEMDGVVATWPISVDVFH